MALGVIGFCLRATSLCHACCTHRSRHRRLDCFDGSHPDFCHVCYRAYKAEDRLIGSNGQLIDRNVVMTLVQMSCNRCALPCLMTAGLFVLTHLSKPATGSTQRVQVAFDKG